VRGIPKESPTHICSVDIVEKATFILAVLPPALAIVVEFLNPINERVLHQSALGHLSKFKDQVHANGSLQIGNQPLANPIDPGANAFDTLVDHVARSSAAAVEVSGVAPTFVACITSGFAVLHELPSPLWLTISYVVAFLILILFLLRLLLGHNFLDIADSVPRFAYWDFFLSREKTVSATIYAANGLLILTACLVFMHLECTVSPDVSPVDTAHGEAVATGASVVTSAQRHGLEDFICHTYQGIFHYSR
jgi:hypothetical protein